MTYPTPSFNDITILGSKGASYVLIAPSGGGAPTWRVCAYADIFGLGTAAELTAGGANGAAVLDADGNASAFTVLPSGGTVTVTLGDIASATLSGTTAERPTASYVGQPYFDTTLGFQVNWNGTDWVNAAGVVS